MDSWEAIANMTNKEAAAVIKNSMLTIMCGRANGKTMMVAALNVALIKAIAALENTPDEKEKEKKK